MFLALFDYLDITHLNLLYERQTALYFTLTSHCDLMIVLIINLKTDYFNRSTF